MEEWCKSEIDSFDKMNEVHLTLESWASLPDLKTFTSFDLVEPSAEFSIKRYGITIRPIRCEGTLRTNLLRCAFFVKTKSKRSLSTGFTAITSA